MKKTSAIHPTWGGKGEILRPAGAPRRREASGDLGNSCRRPGSPDPASPVRGKGPPRVRTGGPPAPLRDLPSKKKRVTATSEIRCTAIARRPARISGLQAQEESETPAGARCGRQVDRTHRPPAPAPLGYVARATWLCLPSARAAPAAAAASAQGPGSPVLLSRGATRC